MRIMLCAFTVLILTKLVDAQNNAPVWGIGTKWTYDFSPQGRTYIPLTNEIIDTSTINGYKLYVVESSPYNSGISYFYYENDLVYSYDERSDRMTLLYNFTEESQYEIEDLPICDPTFPYDSLSYKNYYVSIDSMANVEAENGTLFHLQHVHVPDTLFLRNNTEIIPHTRSIIENVGFGEGGLHYTHHWEIGAYICDEFANYVGKLRCFEKEDTVFNFVGYPCDSSWVISSNSEQSKVSYELYPNPVDRILKLKSDQLPDLLIVRDAYGSRKFILSQTSSIPVDHLPTGYYFLEIVFKNGRREVLPFVKM